jgi:hypothetical protein
MKMHVLYLFILGFLIPHFHKTAHIVVDGNMSCDDANYIPYIYSLRAIEQLLNVSPPYNTHMICSPSNSSIILRRNQNRILFRMLTIQGKVIDLVKCKKKRCRVG